MEEIKNPLESYKEYPGPILLLAGPGTGKTFQIENRVKFLIENQIAKSDEITIITYTNEAAKSMRKRLSKSELNSDDIPHIISTIHSLCNLIIGENYGLVNLPENYTVLTDKITRTILLQDAAQIAVNDREKWLLAHNCRIVGDCNENPEENKCKICNAYKNLLRKCSAIDYDDQLFLACEILKKHNEILTQWQNKSKFLLVDEYQDINQAQYELISLLSSNQTEGLFAVGDDDQSIYSFRGGSPKYILDFDSLFEGEIKIGRLAKSWRCPEHILKGSKNVIKEFYPESSTKPEPVFSEDIAYNNKILFFDVPSHKVESSIISKIISEKAISNKIIILVPNAKYFPTLKNELIKHKIPFNYKRQPDPNGIIKFTKINNWIENKYDNLLLRFILNEIIKNNTTILKELKNKASLKELRLQASNLISNLWQNVNKDKPLYDYLQEQEDDFYIALSSILNDFLKLMLDFKTKKAYLPKFLELCGRYLSPGKNINNFISEINHLFNDVYFAQSDSSIMPIEIYNLPSSKGLEADIVFVIGTTDEIIPNINGSISEQSRLFFVAMTRAKKELYLFHSRTRPASITFKSNSYQLKSSRFFQAINKDHYEYKYIKSRS